MKTVRESTDARRRSWLTCGFIAGVGAVLATLLLTSTASTAATLTRLGFRPEALNNSDYVVGWLTGFPEHAVGWDNGQLAHLPELSGFRSRALAVNDDQTAVGYIQTAAGVQAAFWTSAGATLLPSPGSGSVAEAINNQGTIGGQYADAAGNEHPVVWVGGTWVELQSLGGSQSFVSDINGAGVAAGWSTRPDGSLHAVVWNGVAVHELSGLGDVYSIALAINDAGMVVGAYMPSGNILDPYHAFLWDNGHVTDLGASFNDFSSAEDINSKGQIVGHIGNEAVVWNAGVPTFLSRVLGTQTDAAVAINDAGDMLILSRSGDALLLVPEPSSLAMWLTALTLGLRRFNRRQGKRVRA